MGAQVEEETVSAWVEDSGPGLPEGDTVGIFERFKRGGAQEPEPGGLGLGLWISRSIVERHGGKHHRRPHRAGSDTLHHHASGRATRMKIW